MKTEFSSKWKSSKKPRKQVKYRANAPLHLKRKFMRVHLSAELRKKHGKRSVQIKKNDKVKVIRGKFRGKAGSVDLVSIKKETIYITGVEIEKSEGSKAKVPVHPSNMVITELALDDKKRKSSLERK